MASVTFLLWSAILAGFWPTFGSDPLERTFPLEAKGNIRFQVDAARFLEAGAPTVEVVLSVPEEALRAGADSARVDVRIEPLDAEKHSLGVFSTELRLPPASGAERAFPVPARWIRLYPRWIEGTVGLRITAEAPELSKRGLLDQMHDKHPSGEAAARLVPEGRPAGEIRGLSDLLFVWGVNPPPADSDEMPALRAVRSRLLPNPYRYYGLHQPVLTVYWERYPFGPAGGATPERLLERRRILSLPDSAEVSAVAETIAVPAAAEWALRRVDVSSLRGGGYHLEVALLDPEAPEGVPLARARGDFQVVWESQSWTWDEAALLELGRAILPAGDFERYEELDRGGKEAFLRALWNRLAPTDPGRENPLEAKFRERARYASERFRGLRSGLLSDRGRIHVRFGPPDEVRFELNPQDTELLTFQLPEELRREGEDDPVARLRLSKRRTYADNRAYEIWDYTTRGDPLLPDYVPPGQRLGLKFIFVDELGDGDYSLVYTNAPSALQ